MSGYKALDHYRVLGVDSRAETSAIHRAYRDLARRFHPDLTGDEATMKLINVAWDALRDATRRSEYDRDRNPMPTTIASPAPTESVPIQAGPAPGNPSGPVLTYGRYAGWSLGEIAGVDPSYLEWLRQAPGYRWLRVDIDSVIGAVESAPRVRERERARPGGGFARFANALRG